MNLFNLSAVVTGLLLALVALPNASALSKKLWKEEDYKQVLKADDDDEYDDADEPDDILDKALQSWHSSGGVGWSVDTSATTVFSTVSIEWDSTYADSNMGIDSNDLIGAQTGHLYIVESYVSTYIYSHMFTWKSSGSIIRPDGHYSFWTSQYTSYWTSTWTSSFTKFDVVSTFTSTWTSCTTGEVPWTTTYDATSWNTGSAISGDKEWNSAFSTFEVEDWESTFEHGWHSIKIHSTSSSWYSATTSFFTSEYLL
jgi:hypothetical protein